MGSCARDLCDLHWALRYSNSTNDCKKGTQGEVTVAAGAKLLALQSRFHHVPGSETSGEIQHH